MIKQPLLFLLMEGFGLSGSWKGNAIQTANPVNFNSLWETFSHRVVEGQNSKDFINPELFHSMISTGSEILSNKEVLDQEIEQAGFFHSEPINGFFDHVVSQKSALHLIGHIPGKQSKYSSMQHLEELIVEAKRRKIFRLYLHFFIDDTQDAQPNLALINEKLARIGVGEIASVSSSEYLNVKNLKQLKDAIMLGNAKSALSADQALSLKTGSVLAPTVITSQQRSIGTVSDFDSILFYDFNLDISKDLINSVVLSSPGYPKFVSSGVFFEGFDNSPAELAVFLRRNLPNGLPLVLSQNGLSQLQVYETSRSNYMKFFNSFCQIQNRSDYTIPSQSSTDAQKNYTFIKNETINAVQSAFNNSNFDFIFINVSFLNDAANLGSFTDAVCAVKIMDQLILEIYELTKKVSGNLIITSNHGNAEKIGMKNISEQSNSCAWDPLPFILVNSKSEKELKKVFSNNYVYDMIGRKSTILDIAPTVLDILSLEPLPSMKGKSFLPLLLGGR